MRIVFAGGGTGGHLYPALAIARALVRERSDVRPFFIGAKRGIERDVLPAAGFPHLLLDLHPLYRRTPWQNWKTLAGSVTAWREIAQMVRQERPALVVGTGGYAAGLTMAYAVAHDIPLVQQAGDSIPGLTARWFSRWSREIYLTFPEAKRYLKQHGPGSLIDTGAPIEPPPVPRPDRAAARRRWGFPETGGRVLLVYGGSQGSAAINRAIADWLGRDPPSDIHLIWMTGRSGYAEFAKLESEHVRVREYLSPIADAYAAADLVVARAGAMTTSELFAWGLPAILVPLPSAAADHQTANAVTLERAGAAVHLPQSELSAARLRTAVLGLIDDPRRLEALAAGAVQRARPHAAETIAHRILALVDRRPIHFVGIAGAGMSALAELYVRRGIAVTGCDVDTSGAADLRRVGIPVTEGHDPSHANGARAIVITSAMAKTHPEIERARALGIPVTRRAEALGEITSGGELVAIAGTHGKSTTTAMTTDALASAGLNPTGLVGARIAAWEGNLRVGGDKLYVVEADEYDRSFLALSPTVAVVTNVEADHLDTYRDLADIRSAFAQFAAGARVIVLGADDPGSNSLPTPSSAEVIRFGVTSRDARLVARNIVQSEGGASFDVVFDGTPLGTVALRVPGVHNVRNALAALASGLALGRTVPQMSVGLDDFDGVERRFQRIGESGGITIVDDYAHHPTEIAATLAAARDGFPGRRIVLAFQPHLYSRTRDFAREFGRVLDGADLLFLADIYPAREKPIPGVTSDLIVRELGSATSKLVWRGAQPDMARALLGTVHSGDVVITMGAGDVTKSAPALLAMLERR
jgi:UDP-N-acetylmuramate--alanine ligase